MIANPLARFNTGPFLIAVFLITAYRANYLTIFDKDNKLCLHKRQITVKFLNTSLA
ncbi:hypothetical protein CJA_3283 [Cellvibrio japonicus Ueda107]|uniref:Uncharacterized protein n=1 Tax=Cellvibrio japonicus (strain Ueda107) TaxID=498211 RepID=B3PEI1_CELJU|nr:hypothetical protein CJA_3283 [Cellvibrio japonicus Ueda107]